LVKVAQRYAPLGHLYSEIWVWVKFSSFWGLTRHPGTGGVKFGMEWNFGIAIDLVVFAQHSRVTNTQTTLRATSVAICRIYALHAYDVA